MELPVDLFLMLTLVQAQIHFLFLPTALAAEKGHVEVVKKIFPKSKININDVLIDAVADGNLCIFYHFNSYSILWLSIRHRHSGYTYMYNPGKYK